MAWVEIADGKVINLIRETLEDAQDEIVLNKILKLILVHVSKWDNYYIEDKLWKKMYKMSKKYMEDKI